MFKKIFIFRFAIGILFALLVFYNLRYILKTRAANPELYIKIKLQGDYSQNKDPSIKAKIALYTPYAKVTELTAQPLTQEDKNIFSVRMPINGFDLTQTYSIFIKPEKYIGRLSPKHIFVNSQNNIDLTKDVFLTGDIKPFDGKVDSFDFSSIFRDLGKTVDPSADTDVNYNLITNTQDYSLALYSLGQNAVDDKILLATPSATPTTAPTNTPKPTKKPTKTPIPTKVPTSIPTPTTSSSTTPTVSNIPGSCNTMDNGLPNSSMIYPNSYVGTPSTTKQIWNFSHTKNYSIPYRNPSCTLTQDAINKAYDRMKTFYPSYYPQTKLLTDWQTVQTYAKKYNFNPIFVVSVWIEESAAGGATASQQLGCLYRHNKDNTYTYLDAKSTICEQMECLFGSGAVVPTNFGIWACQYQFGAGEWNGTTCNKEPGFAKTVEFWYSYLSTDQPDSCKPKYCPGITGC